MRSVTLKFALLLLVFCLHFCDAAEHSTPKGKWKCDAADVDGEETWSKHQPHDETNFYEYIIGEYFLFILVFDLVTAGDGKR